MLRINLSRIFRAFAVHRPTRFLVEKGYTYSTAQRLVVMNHSRFRLEDLEQLCLRMGCTPNDILEWVPNQDQVSLDTPLQQLRFKPEPYFDQLLNKLQATLRDFTAEEFAALDAAGQMDWRFVEGQKRYIYRAAETLVATHPDLAARQLDPPAPATLARERRRRIHDQMEREGQASARITLKTSVGMSDEAFAAALAKAKAEGRESVHVRAWLPIPAECLAQSEIELQSFTEQPGRIADANAPQRTVCWEADLTENRRFGVQYRYKTTAVYADPLDFVPA